MPFPASEISTMDVRNVHSHTGAVVPAIVIGGKQNALSVARNLARSGVRVIAINYPHEPIRFSRYAQFIHFPRESSPLAWVRFLLSSESNHLRGSVLLLCSDEVVSTFMKHYSMLSQKYLLEETPPQLRLNLLDKFTTYKCARQAGIDTVECWRADPGDDISCLAPSFPYPLIVKPCFSPHSHLLDFKACIVTDPETLRSRVDQAGRLGVSLVLMEFIPGGDDRLCSYYTYIDENGRSLVHLTKRVKRRFPTNGDGTYHVTEWIPEAAELGLRFFRNIKYRGLGNIEFKSDERDGRLKLIEVNARFTASDCLIAKSGVNLPRITYNRITGRPQEPVLDYRKSLVLCRPIEDMLAASRLYMHHQLSLRDWLGEVRQVTQFPFFELLDPAPAFAELTRRAWRLASRLLTPYKHQRNRRTSL